LVSVGEADKRKCRIAVLGTDYFGIVSEISIRLPV
jgi:hypothetical protein